MRSKMAKKTKICFICSSGGHHSELKNMVPLKEKYDSFLITEKVENFRTNLSDKVYFVKEINRKEKLFLFSSATIENPSFRFNTFEVAPNIFSVCAN